MAATVFARQRVSGLDRCAYSVGPAPEVRGRLFLPLAGPWWLEGEACRSAEGGVWDDLCERPTRAGPTERTGAFRESGDILRGRGHVVAAGDLRRRRGRESCPRTRGLSPAGADRTRPRGMFPPASGMRSPQVAAEARDPCQSRRPPARNCQQSGWMTWDASGPHPHKRPMSDKPDLSLVHLGGVQGSGFLCGNRSTSYGRRRIPDRSGRPSVAVHQSNRQGRSRAPSSGQVRDDVSRGDQGAPGR